MGLNPSLDTAVKIDLVLDQGSRTPLYQQIVDRVWRDVIDGTLQSGQRLPTVRQLAIDLGVHLDTVTRAYQQLEHLGVVYGRRGAGTFVGIKASQQAELQRQKRLEEICRHALRDAEQVGASVDDLLALLNEMRRGNSSGRSG